MIGKVIQNYELFWQTGAFYFYMGMNQLHQHVSKAERSFLGVLTFKNKLHLQCNIDELKTADDS